jgi:hypothetical protein
MGWVKGKVIGTGKRVDEAREGKEKEKAKGGMGDDLSRCYLR